MSRRGCKMLGTNYIVALAVFWEGNCLPESKVAVSVPRYWRTRGSELILWARADRGHAG